MSTDTDEKAKVKDEDEDVVEEQTTPVHAEAGDSSDELVSTFLSVNDQPAVAQLAKPAPGKAAEATPPTGAPEAPPPTDPAKGTARDGAPPKAPVEAPVEGKWQPPRWLNPKQLGGDPPGGRPGELSDKDREELEATIKRIETLLKAQKELVEKATEYIKANGTDPKDAVLDAVKNNNVTFIGETHTIGTANPTRDLITKAISEMPAGSRLAVELPDALKPVFDAFNKSKPGSDFEIPETLEGKYGKEALELLKKIKELSPDLIEMWKAARDKGIAVVPIDNNSVVMPDTDPAKAAESAKRDQHMQELLLDMVKQDPKSHVVAYLGSMHGVQSRDAATPAGSAAQLLADNPQFKKLGGKMTTFFTQISEGFGVGTALHPATKAIDKPLAVTTTGKDGKPNAVADVPIFGSPRLNMSQGGHHLRAFDNVIVFPQSEADKAAGGADFGDLAEQRKAAIKQTAADIAAMKGQKYEPSVKPDKYYDATAATESEAERLGVSVEAVKKMKAEINADGTTPEAALGAAMKDSKVVALEIEQTEWKQHMEFAAKAMAEMKKNGATHAVLDLPVEAQSLLDSFNKTGIVDRTKLDPMAITDYQSALMQAALNSGLKLVAGGMENWGNNAASADRAKVVQEVLKDPKAKVVLLGGSSQIATGKDEDGVPSTVQRLKDAGVTVQSALLVPGDFSLERANVLSGSLTAPVAVRTDKAPTLGKLVNESFGNKAPLSAWNLVIMFPPTRK